MHPKIKRCIPFWNVFVVIVVHDGCDGNDDDDNDDDNNNNNNNDDDDNAKFSV